MATASVTIPGAVGVIHCPLPARVEDAISAVHKMQPGESFGKHGMQWGSAGFIIERS